MLLWWAGLITIGHFGLVEAQQASSSIQCPTTSIATSTSTCPTIAPAVATASPGDDTYSSPTFWIASPGLLTRLLTLLLGSADAKNYNEAEVCLEVCESATSPKAYAALVGTYDALSTFWERALMRDRSCYCLANTNDLTPDTTRPPTAAETCAGNPYEWW